MTTEELLNEMEREAEFHSEETPVCIIDPETRTITVPPEYQLLGVESDEKVERLYFQCPKIVGDNVDLSQLILFINYQNAGQEIDAYKITDVETDGDNITFSWLLDRKVTAYRTTQQNKLGFSFCAQKADEDGTLTQEWNTTINTECSVLEGLEAQEHIEEENSAAIAQVWQAIDELKAGGGGGGTPGKDGREIELQKSSTAIQWRYVGDESWTDLVQLSDLKGNKGDKGDTGATPNIQIGTVQTLEPGQDATASMTGTPENPLLNLGIPKGENAEGNSYELPIMSSTQLGGGKAVAKTDEDVPVAVDPLTGQLFVPTYPENSGTVDPEQIKQAVNGYLEENPVQPTPIDKTLTLENQAADAKITGNAIKNNSEKIDSLSEEKLNKNQGISNSGKYLVVGADGNITFSDESTDSPEKPLGDYNYSLPDGYKKVDYIDSKGTLYYFLDWTPTVNSRMLQKVIPIEGVNMFIGFAADNNLSFGYQINVSGKKVVTYLGDSFAISKSEKSFEPDYKQYITVDIANGSQKVEGLEIGTKTSIFDVYESWNNKYPIVGGAFQTWYASGSQIALTRHKLVRCQIYESEELVYDFVPALRETDSVCGLYDLVNSSFALGRTYNNYTQSYDYGEIIDDTGGQNGENAENTHIIVSEMTGDAIQDAINQCKSSGGGVIELLPGGVYICDSPLTIYTDRVDIIGNGAKLDFSGISSDIVCVTLQSSGDISDYSEMIREEYLHYVRGVYFVGPNRTANYEGGRIGTALMFTGTETKISTGYTVDNCVIAGFKTGVDLFTNSWCVKFSNCDISVCDTGIQMISGGQNYGEKFTFTSCTIHSCSVGAVCNHNAGTLQFLGCAMDYNFCAFKTDNQAHIIFTGGHIENNKDKNYFCICSNFGIVLIANSVLHGSQTQYGFASVSEAGKVIMSNCMKESWTMGEDEKDDNGNSKIIYDWINFAS